MNISKVLMGLFLIILNSIVIKSQENGKVNEFLNFQDYYAGTINNQHCFLVKDKKIDLLAKYLKVYDPNMKKIKEVEIPFDMVMGKFETINNMIHRHYGGVKEENKTFSYNLYKQELYDIEDFSKPKYVCEYERYPNLPFFDKKDWKNVSSSFHFAKSNNRTISLCSINLDNVKDLSKYKLENTDKSYMVITNEKLEFLYKGFINLPKGSIKQVLIENNDIIIVTKNPSNSKRDIHHIKISNDKIISLSKIEVPENYCYDLRLNFSPDKSKLGISFYYTDDKEEAESRKVKKYRGEGLCVYNLDSKKIEKYKFYPFTKLIKFKKPHGDNSMSVALKVSFEKDGKIYYKSEMVNNFIPYWIGDKIILINTKITLASAPQQSSTTHGGYSLGQSGYHINTRTTWKSVGESAVLPDEFTLKVVNNNLEVEFEKEYDIQVAWGEAYDGTNNFSILYDEKDEKLNVLYFNYALREEKDKEAKDDEKGSHIIQLSYDNGGFNKSFIPMPENSKYFKRGGGMYKGQNRDHYFTLSPISSFNNFLIVNISPYKDKNDILYQIIPNN